MENMGQKIHKHRTALEMTLTEFGKRVGVGTSTARKWETGYIKDMKSDKIQRVAEVLEISPAYLMGWKETPEIEKKQEDDGNMLLRNSNIPYVTDKNESIQLSEEETELLRIYKNLSVKGRVQLLSKAISLENEETEK